jgi:hypothetical protein
MFLHQLLSRNQLPAESPLRRFDPSLHKKPGKWLQCCKTVLELDHTDAPPFAAAGSSNNSDNVSQDIKKNKITL